MPAPISNAWSALLSTLDKLVSPDWGDPIHWLPLIFTGVVVLVLAMTAMRWRSMADMNRSRVARPLTSAAPPPGVHMPGPSPWPFFLPIGLAISLFALVIHPAGQHVNAPVLLVGLVVTLAVLAGWIRDAMLDWQRVDARTSQAALGDTSHVSGEMASPSMAVASLPSGTWVVPRRLPAVASTVGGDATAPAAAAPHAVHLPAPSPWPFFLPVGAFFVLFGLVMDRALLAGGLLMTLIALAGWFRDAGREFRQVDAGLVAGPADRDPERAFPKRLVGVYAAIAAASILLGAGPSIIAAVNASPAAAQPTTAAAGAGAVASAGAQLHVTAQGIRFDQATLTAAAGQPLTIVFDNKDSVPHNIAIFDSSAMTKSYFHGTVVTGPKTVTYSVPALQPGTYYFHCDVHPTMNGTLVVK
jgi:plastocyanin